MSLTIKTKLYSSSTFCLI
uniref:Uncharacterized protein n=1 Tax=Anguilla anguilla TaxID=7936 RepID=A0A0E9VNF8_ANGAN